MKTLKVLSFLLIGTIGIQTTFASDAMKLGIRAGLNLAKMEYSRTGSYEYEEFYNGVRQGKSSSEETSDQSYMFGNLIGFQIGAVLDVKITDFLYVQPGIMFSSKGSDTESEEKETRTSSSGNTDSYKDKSKDRFNPYYIDVPIMLSLKGTLAENLALRAQAGPYIGIGLFGGAESKREDFSNGTYREEKREMKDVFSPTDKEKEELRFGGFSRFNFGIGFGTGIEYSNFYLGLSYNYGLTNLMNKYEYSDFDEGGYSEKGSREMNVYERTFSITLGYNF